MSDPHDVEGRLAPDHSLDDLNTAHLKDLVLACEVHITQYTIERLSYLDTLARRRREPGVDAFLRGRRRH